MLLWSYSEENRGWRLAWETCSVTLVASVINFFFNSYNFIEGNVYLTAGFWWGKKSVFEMKPRGCFAFAAAECPSHAQKSLT